MKTVVIKVEKYNVVSDLSISIIESGNTAMYEQLLDNVLCMLIKDIRTIVHGPAVYFNGSKFSVNNMEACDLLAITKAEQSVMCSDGKMHNIAFCTNRSRFAERIIDRIVEYSSN